MKRIWRIIFLVFLIFISVPIVHADEKNLVNIYLFHSDTCPHCKAEIKLLDELEKKYDNIRIYKFEISDADNLRILDDISEIYDTTVSGTPFTIIGDRYFHGYSEENTKQKFMAVINYYSDNGYQDRVGEYLGNVELPKYPIKEDQEDVNEYIEKYTSRRITIFGHTIETKNLTLPVIAILIGLVDGFNPCAMWVLLFLISMLIGMNDKKRMWVIGLAFLLTSAIVYLLFMLAWLNAAKMLLAVSVVRIIIGLIAIAGAIINIRSYIKHRKDNGCDVISDNKRSKIFGKIKKFTKENNLVLAILGAMTLAISVNIVELACSAGLPVMFIEILTMNNLTGIENVIYIALYMLFFLLDDLIVFFIAVNTMELTGFSTKYGKVSKLVGGILLLLIGVLLIFRPGWLQFSF